MIKRMIFKKVVFKVVAGVWLFLSVMPSFAQSVSASQWATPLTSDSIQTQLSAYRGKVLWVDFWASWCPPCRASFPWMNQMQQRYGAKGLQIIGINVDENPADARRFLQHHPAQFQVFFDPNGDAPGRFNVQGMPTSYLIDRHGKIRMVHIGFEPTQKQALERAIVQALSE